MIGRGGERERGIEGKKARWRAKVWEDEMEGGSGDYRLSGVFYLWSKCTLAFLLSSPQMQLDSSLAKQTQMKWLLNDFLGNPPRQRKPSIWSLLFHPLPLSPPSFLFFLLPIFSLLLTLILCQFPVCFSLIWLHFFCISSPLSCIFPLKIHFPALRPSFELPFSFCLDIRFCFVGLSSGFV